MQERNGVYNHLSRVGRLARHMVPLVSAIARDAADHLRRPRFPSSAETLLAGFRSGTSPTAEDYSQLFRYFALGWESYRSASGAGGRYPGLPSWSGSQADELEGFSRIMPLFGAWCSSERSTECVGAAESTLYLEREFERGLLAGTDRNSPDYWGDMPGKSNQRIVEAADVALALWFFRNSVWRRLSSAQRENVVSWLLQARGRPGLDNNWQLFFVLIDRVLAALDTGEGIPDARERWNRIRTFHLGDGWFEDGPGGRVDYYNAWGFHFLMHWIDRIDPDWDPVFIHSCQRRFLSSYRHLISPRGFPILGRSICYRLAAPAPLILAHEQHPDIVSAGEARRSLDVTWSYFAQHGAIGRGTVSQGYFGADPRILDNYSGPASPLWSLRSLTAAFSIPAAAPFWTDPPEPLPIERGDFDLFIEGPRWMVRGDHRTQRITIEVQDNPSDAAPALQPYRLRRRLWDLADGTASRPKNDEAKNGRRVYRSDPPFCL